MTALKPILTALGLDWLTKALTSSVGKKFVMGITGLLLCGFLVTHLAGNLLLLVNDGGASYNAYAHALHDNPKLIIVVEVMLALLFFTHIYLAIATTLENRSARGPVGYEEVNSKIEKRTLDAKISPSNWMFVSGAVILGFVLLHLFDFTLEFRTDIDYEKTTEVHGEEIKDAYSKAESILQTPVSIVVYAVGCLFLGLHLRHGFSSAFQSLGFNHPKWNPIIHYVGIAFAISIAAGFGFFIFWAN